MNPRLDILTALSELVHRKRDDQSGQEVFHSKERMFGQSHAMITGPGQSPTLPSQNAFPFVLFGLDNDFSNLRGKNY